MTKEEARGLAVQAWKHGENTLDKEVLEEFTEILLKTEAAVDKRYAEKLKEVAAKLPPMPLEGRDSPDFLRALLHAVNKDSRENGSDTPDFILAQFMADCLSAFDKCSRSRENWYGTSLRIGGVKSMGAEGIPPSAFALNDGTREVLIIQKDGSLLMWSTKQGKLAPIGELESEADVRSAAKTFYEALGAMIRSGPHG